MRSNIYEFWNKGFLRTEEMQYLKTKKLTFSRNEEKSESSERSSTESPVSNCFFSLTLNQCFPLYYHFPTSKQAYCNNMSW